MRWRTMLSIHEPATLPGAGNTNATEVEDRVKHNDGDSIYDPDASLARIDAIAAAVLSSKSLAEASDRSAVISRSET